MKIKISVDEIRLSETIEGIAEELIGDLRHLWESGKYQIRCKKAIYTHARKTKKGMIFVSRREYNELGGYREIQRQIAPTHPVFLEAVKQIKNIDIG